MSGRGRGRGGRGERGKFQGKSSVSSTTRNENQETKKSAKDWNYYIGSAKQASDFEATTEYLVNHIKETFDYGGDIAMAIVNQEPINTDSWKPKLQKSSDSDPDIKETENEQYKIEFQANFNNYGIRDRTYTNNIIKAYALFWGKCAKGMRNKIEARSDFK